jgi:hypothetical protein
MKWAGGFLTGVLVGALAVLAGIFFYLRSIPAEPTPPAARMPAVVAPALAPARAPAVSAAPQAPETPTSDLATVRTAALRLRGGGVGFYPDSQFVHLDTGRIRSW